MGRATHDAAPGGRRVRIAAVFAAGVVAALAAMAAGALITIEAGLFDATATKPHHPLVGWATHTAFIRSVLRRGATVRPPADLSAEQAVAGARLYEQNCVMCHGGPSVPRAGWTQGLTPTPPFLVDAARRWTPGQLYWIISQGVKMTAMPAWIDMLPPDRIWQLVAFIDSLPTMTPAEYRRLTAAAGAP